MFIKRYFAVDNNVQYKTILVLESNGVTSVINFPWGIDGPFLTDIFSRELHFINKKFDGETFYGWALSRNEYEKLKRLAELYPAVEEYNKIIKGV